MANLSSWSAYQGWQIQDGDRLDQDRWRRRRGCSGKSQRGRGIGCRPGHDHDDDDGDDGDDGHYDTDGDVSGVTDTLGKWTPTPLLHPRCILMSICLMYQQPWKWWWQLCWRWWFSGRNWLPANMMMMKVAINVDMDDDDNLWICV